MTWATGSWLQARAASAGHRRSVVAAGAGLIVVGIEVTSFLLLPGASWVVAAVGWGVAGLGMGLAYSMLALLILETAPPGQEGISSAALQLMFTLGTAFGAGIGGAMVALADRGTLSLPAAVGTLNAIMLVTGILAAAVALRVPAGPAERPARGTSARPCPSSIPRAAARAAGAAAA